MCFLFIILPDSITINGKHLLAHGVSDGDTVTDHLHVRLHPHPRPQWLHLCHVLCDHCLQHAQAHSLVRDQVQSRRWGWGRYLFGKQIVVDKCCSLNPCAIVDSLDKTKTYTMLWNTCNWIKLNLTLKIDSERHNDPDCEKEIEGDDKAEEQEDDEESQLAGYPGNLHYRCQCFVNLLAAALCSHHLLGRRWEAGQLPGVSCVQLTPVLSPVLLCSFYLYSRQILL